MEYYYNCGICLLNFVIIISQVVYSSQLATSWLFLLIFIVANAVTLYNVYTYNRLLLCNTILMIVFRSSIVACFNANFGRVTLRKFAYGQKSKWPSAIERVGKFIRSSVFFSNIYLFVFASFDRVGRL